jgi:NADH dehydrogenase FAD-containing subunit
MLFLASLSGCKAKNQGETGSVLGSSMVPAWLLHEIRVATLRDDKPPLAGALLGHTPNDRNHCDGDPMTKRGKRIAIIGGNFAGLTAAIKLSRRHAVTVIDPSRHFEWMPNIHEVLSSVKTPKELRLDRAAIIQQAGHHFLHDRVTVVQPAQRRLITAGGSELEFDACIVAVGALWNTHHIPGVTRHAMPFRSVADSVAIETRLHTLVREGKPLRIVIAGGGISGIEALGEILRRHRNNANLSVEMVEAGDRLLPGMAPALDADLRRLCEPYAVKFRTGTTIASVSAKGVRLADGVRLRSELTLWTAGLAPPALLRESGLSRPPLVWADVHQTLQSRHFDSSFIVGDAAQLPQPVGKQAYNAIDMGALAATNVSRFLDGRALKPFKPAPKPVLIAFGDLQTYLVAGHTVVASKALAGAKEGVYQVFMAQMAPGSVLTSLPASAGRLWQSWRQLALPQLKSLADYRKLGDLRPIKLL